MIVIVPTDQDINTEADDAEPVIGSTKLASLELYGFFSALIVEVRHLVDRHIRSTIQVVRERMRDHALRHGFEDIAVARERTRVRPGARGEIHDRPACHGHTAMGKEYVAGLKDAHVREVLGRQQATVASFDVRGRVDAMLGAIPIIVD